MVEAKWYVVNTVVGYEAKAAALIKEETKKRGIEGDVLDVVVPTEVIKRNQRGKKVQVEKKMMPGYIFVKICPSDVVWNVIRNTQYVMKFLGVANKPSEVPEEEVNAVLHKMEEIRNDEGRSDTVDVGEMVKIIEGAFAGFSAIVEQVNLEKNKIRVSVSIFGRETPLELTKGQVERIDASDV